jgi:low temperature requirement protein LtrA
MATRLVPAARIWRRAVVRDPHEQHRAATPLELFFDLCIIVAVSLAAHELESLLVEHRYANALIGFGTGFVALWWAWMNFTWFATAHDSDDIPYRILTFVQISGGLVIAAGLPTAMADRDFTVVVIGYVLMRVALVAQWWRVRGSVPEHRDRATMYAVGILLVQVLWIAWLAVPRPLQLPGWLALMLAEVLVPVVAERRSHRTVFHVEHIAERYGLLTIIVLGESVLASTVSMRDAVDAVGMSAEVVVLAGGAVLIAYCAWWLYFNRPGHNEPAAGETVFAWGYGHLPVFASLAAFGSGVQLTAAWLDHRHAGDRLASLGIAIPAAGYLVSLALIDLIARARRGPLPLKLAEAAVILAVGLIAPPPVTVLVTAAGYVFAVVMLELRARDRPALESAAAT